MMRVILAVLWGLALFGFWTAQEGQSADARRGKTRGWPQEVDGLGLDDSKAKENTLKTARARVIASLRQSQPPIEAWEPTEEDVQAMGQWGKGTDVPLEPGNARRWVFHLKPPDWDRFYKEEAAAQKAVRGERGQERMLLLGKILGGIVVLLLAVIAYVRLDDLTQGYYTRRLQLACAGLIAATVAGLWLLSW